jgi:hypothetical protein
MMHDAAAAANTVVKLLLMAGRQAGGRDACMHLQAVCVNLDDATPEITGWWLMIIHLSLSLSLSIRIVVSSCYR